MKAEEIRSLRQQSQLTPQQLARLLNVSPKHYRSLESAERRSTAELDAIFDVLKQAIREGELDEFLRSRNMK